MSDEQPINAPPQIVAAPLPVVEEPALPPLLHHIPLPQWVLAMAAITLAAFVFGLVRMPKAISMGVSAEKGERALAAGDGNTAIKYLTEVHQQYPNSIDISLDLAEADFKAEEYKGVADVLDSLAGKQATKEQSERADRIAADMNNLIEEAEKNEKAEQNAAGKGKK